METFYRFIFAPVALVAFIVSGCNFKCLIYYNFVCANSRWSEKNASIEGPKKHGRKPKTKKYI